jgi:aspartate kinase
LLITKKFGGSSLETRELIFNVAENIKNDYEKNNKLVVILSARGNITDELIKSALEINNNPPKRELDVLLSTGETQSVSLMSMALNAMNVPSVSLNAFQAEIFCDDNYCNARIINIKTDRIFSELEKNNVVLITGFQARNFFGDVLTLGRGGSDTSAVAFAVALRADLCEIFTDVDGIYTADPRIISSAKKLDEINFDEMLELASLGAVVMHNRAIELAKKYNINLCVKSSFKNNSSGTKIMNLNSKSGEINMEKTLVSGVALDKKIAMISLIGLEDEIGMTFKLFSVLARKDISIDLIIQSIGRHSAKDISFTLNIANFNKVIKILEVNQDFLKYDHLVYREDVAKISIVGSGIASNPEIGMKIFEALYNQNISIKMISTSEIKISLLVLKNDCELAAREIHKNLIN